MKTIHENITCIERLFTLLTGKSEITELKGIKEKTEINILSPYLLKENNDKRKFAIQLNNKNIEKIFKNWLTNYAEMNSVYSLFYSINESEVNAVTLFLTYSQILENYHRQKYNGKYLTEKEFKPIQKEIKENINSLEIEKLHTNEKLKNKIFTSLDHDYEYTFKDRLIEIFNKLESYDFFNKILEKPTKNSNKPIEELAKIIKDNRNYYTHYGNKPKRVFLPEKKLHEINESINKIIQLIFLKELGFEAEEINKYIDYPQFYLGHYINLEY